jgi:hypothetical protein
MLVRIQKCANLKKILSLSEEAAMVTESFLLRVFWGVVDNMPSHQLQSLSDTTLLPTLMHQVSRQVQLTTEELDFLRGYIGNRVPLIREIAGAYPA